MKEKPKRKRRTQAERSALSDRRILEAAERLIARQGFARTTLAQIGKAAGYTGALVSQRYGSKEGVARLLLKRLGKGSLRSEESRRAAEGKVGLEALEAYVGAYIDELRSRETRIRLLYVLLGEGLSRGGRDLSMIRQGLVRVLAALAADFQIAAGSSGDEDLHVEATFLEALVGGMALLWLLNPGSFDLDKMGESIREVTRWRVEERAGGRSPE